MTPELHPGRWRRLRELFDDALDRAPEARPGFLAGLRPEDADLAAEVAAMLRAHDTEALAIEEGVLAPEPDGVLAGRRIGPYQVVALIGRGGMGEVYLAERDDQYRQRVALKVVRAGLAGRDLRARFRVERQILARLAHASIARLLDGGVTEDGRPYLVMEHIEGVPLTEWCERQGPALAARLRLFLSVCRAVGFAHRNLVVHRDLKPSNILVSGEGDVKLLDFGIAKLLDPEDRPAAETGTGLGPMTPDHAAPEQVKGEPVTTATDVYALGVLLYELASGRKPHRLGERPLAELLRDVCERDPPPPSAVAEPGQRRALRGDLDAIALKALRKEPEQRYRSAEELALDVERHLEGRPVLARHGTALYRASRFTRRHAMAVGAAATVALVLVGSSILTWVQSREVARERDAARSERDTAEQVVQVLVGLFEASDPTKVPGGDALTVRELLSRSEAQVLRQLARQPRVLARVRRALGEMYLARSDVEPAQRHLQAALDQLRSSGGTEAEAVAVEHQLALLTRRRGADAVPLLRRTLAAHRELYGDEALPVAAALQDLAEALPPADAAERSALLQRSLEMRRRLRPAGHPDVAASLQALALHHAEGGDLAEAERLLVEARAALEAHPDRGPDHPLTLDVMGHLALVYNRTDRFEQSEALQRAVLAQKTRIYGADSPAVANVLNNLAVTQAHRGDLEGAAQSLERVRELHARRLGAEHWETANAVRNLARVRELQGRYPEALSLMREAYQANRRRGDASRMQHVMAGQLGVLLARTGARAEGLRLLRQAYSALDAMFPGGHMHVADTGVALARALLLTEPAAPAELAEAERVARRALEIRTAQHAAAHPRVAEARCWLGIVLAARGRPAEANPLLRESIPRLERWGAADPADLAEARRRLSRIEAHAARR